MGFLLLRLCHLAAGKRRSRGFPSDFFFFLLFREAIKSKLRQEAADHQERSKRKFTDARKHAKQRVGQIENLVASDASR